MRLMNSVVCDYVCVFDEGGGGGIKMESRPPKTTKK